MPKQDGSLWQAHRQACVTERKHLPNTDVAAAGGWWDVGMLKPATSDPTTQLSWPWWKGVGSFGSGTDELHSCTHPLFSESIEWV